MALPRLGPGGGPLPSSRGPSVSSESGPSESGPSESGPSESGPSESGPSESGRAESGRAESGRAETRPSRSGSLGLGLFGFRLSEPGLSAPGLPELDRELDRPNWDRPNWDRPSRDCPNRGCPNRGLLNCGRLALDAGAARTWASRMRRTAGCPWQASRVSTATWPGRAMLGGRAARCPPDHPKRYQDRAIPPGRRPAQALRAGTGWSAVTPPGASHTTPNSSSSAGVVCCDAGRPEPGAAGAPGQPGSGTPTGSAVARAVTPVATADSTGSCLGAGRARHAEAAAARYSHTADPAPASAITAKTTSITAALSMPCMHGSVRCGRLRSAAPRRRLECSDGSTDARHQGHRR